MVLVLLMDKPLHVSRLDNVDEDLVDVWRDLGASGAHCLVGSRIDPFELGSWRLTHLLLLCLLLWGPICWFWGTWRSHGLVLLDCWGVGLSCGRLLLQINLL
jgi:hypothetical protein